MEKTINEKKVMVTSESRNTEGNVISLSVQDNASSYTFICFPGYFRGKCAHVHTTRVTLTMV